MPLLATVPDIELPDGSFIPGPLLGSQEPRFRTVPPRHRLKAPGLPDLPGGHGLRLRLRRL